MHFFREVGIQLYKNSEKTSELLKSRRPQILFFLSGSGGLKYVYHEACPVPPCLRCKGWFYTHPDSVAPVRHRPETQAVYLSPRGRKFYIVQYSIPKYSLKWRRFQELSPSQYQHEKIKRMPEKLPQQPSDEEVEMKVIDFIFP
jgi:hypothetical protein